MVILRSEWFEYVPNFKNIKKMVKNVKDEEYENM